MVLTKREIIPPPRETAQVLQELINNRKQIKAREYERNRRKLTSYEFIENAAKPLVSVMKGMFEDINSWDIKKLKDGRISYARLSWENIEAILSQLNRMDRNEAVEILADVANKLPNPLTEQRELINKLGAVFAQTPKGQSVSIEKLNKLGMVASPGDASEGAMGAYRRRAGRFTGVYAPTNENPFPPQGSAGSAAPPPTGAEPTAETDRLPRGENTINNLRRNYGDSILGFVGELLTIGHPEDIRIAVEDGKEAAEQGLTEGEIDNYQNSELGRLTLKSKEAYEDMIGMNGEQAKEHGIADIKLYMKALEIAENLQGRPYEIQKIIEMSQTMPSTFGARSAQQEYTGLSNAERHAQQYEAPNNPALGMDDDYFGQPEFRESPPESPRELPAKGNVARNIYTLPIVQETKTGEHYRIKDRMGTMLLVENVGTKITKTASAHEFREIHRPLAPAPTPPEEIRELPTASAPMVGEVRSPMRTGFVEQLKGLKPSAPQAAPMPRALHKILGRRPDFSTEEELDRRLDKEAKAIWDLTDEMSRTQPFAGAKKGIVIENLEQDYKDTGETEQSQLEQIKENIMKGENPLKDTLADIYSYRYQSVRQVAEGIVKLVEGNVRMEPPPAYDIIKDVAEGRRPTQDMALTPYPPTEYADFGEDTSNSPSEVVEGKGASFTPNKKWNPLKLAANGDLGDINVALQKLLEHRELVVKKKKGGKVMIRKKDVPLDLIRLLTRRFNPKSTYSDDAKGIYRKIISLAKVPLGQSHSQKEHIMGTGFKLPTPPLPNEETEIIEEHKPDDVIEKLMVALGTWKNGNRNNIVKNKISSYADFLLKHNLIDKKEHKLLHQLIQSGKTLTPELNEFLNEIFS